MRLVTLFVASLLGFGAMAQTSGVKLDSSQPIEVVSDNLEVFQEQQKAIFSGNVIATQGNINMRAATMTVYYRDTGAEDAPESTGMAGEGIYRIDAEGDVFFASPLETAQGQTAVYDVDGSTITLVGNVLLTRENNVLRGTQMVYNLGTGRSVLSSAASAGGNAGGRVRGLFVPKNKQGSTP